MRRLLLVILMFSVFATEGQTVAPQRLVAQTSYYRQDTSMSFTLVDSTRYFYDDSLHGSRFNYSTLQYPDATDFIFTELPTNNIDTANYRAIDFDSCAHYAYNKTRTERRTLSPNGYVNTVNTAEYSFGNVLPYPLDRTINIYAAGLLVKGYREHYNAGGYDTDFVRYLIYDGNKRPVVDSITTKLSNGVYRPYTRVHYTYGAGNGFLTRVREKFYTNPATFKTLDITINSYYPDGTLKTIYNKVPVNGGASYQTDVDSLGYTPDVEGITYELHKPADSGVYWAIEVITNRINANGKKDSVTFIQYQNGSFLSGNTYKVFYDSAGFPTQFRDCLLDSNYQSRFVAYSKYYYNKPLPLATQNANKPAARVILSPNPTTGHVVLHYTAALAKTPIVVRILNMAGQLIYSETFIPKGASDDIFLSNEIAPGDYAISITSADNTAFYKGIITKK